MAELGETVDLDQAPARIGPYRLARRLGRGGMGEVFLAWDERLGRRVALKRIRRDGPVGQKDERIRREARAAAQLSHPAVVQVYDLLEEASGVVIVLEYVEGRTLRALLAEGVPGLSLALRLARDISEGLAAAHAAGLVHRDLKAENIMVTPEGRAKILDFGLAKPYAAELESEALTAQGIVLGTFHTMSPEQARGGEIDARSDLFSLGVLLYELLTGRSPFRGSDPLDTLQKVDAHSPPPVSTLRPDLPGGLSDLVARLLAKRREDRPGGAEEVARELAALAAAPPGDGATTFIAPAPAEGGWSEPPAAAAPAPSYRRPAGTEVRASSALARLRRPSSLLLILALPLLVLAAVFVLRRLPAEPLRVVVLTPQIPVGGEEDLGLASSGLLAASLATLAVLEGVSPLDPTQAGAGAASPVEVARAAAADEVIAVSLERKGPQGAWASLRRIEGSTGRVLWAGSFQMPAGRGDRDFQLLADAMAVQLRRAYPDHRLRSGIPALDASDRDYAELLRIRERMDRGSADLKPELARLEQIVHSSPRFLEAHLLIAGMARSLFESTRDAGHLERARQAARVAAELAPGDPRPLEAGFRIALAGRQTQEAEETLAALSRLVPGDPQLHVLSGLLAESRGDLRRAVEDLSSAIQRAPSWHNLFLLADLELRAGRTDDARRHLEELLARNPGNAWGMDRLGSLELVEGDLERSIAIYRELIRRQPLRPFYTNLGLAHSLLGRPAEAAGAFRQALALDPDHAQVLLNLADAELAQGHDGEARDLYRRALLRFDEIDAAGALSVKDGIDKAQCLARLGRTRDAVELTQQMLRKGSDDPELFYAASLVYALAGDRASFLVNAELALDNGIQPRWFDLPVFGALRNDPELRTLLQRPPA